MIEKMHSIPRAEINHDLCMGTSMCLQSAPRGFRLNYDHQAEFQDVFDLTYEELLDAALSCPMGAIKVIESEPIPEPGSSK
jgi:ferredoxin